MLLSSNDGLRYVVSLDAGILVDSFSCCCNSGKNFVNTSFSGVVDLWLAVI